MRKYLSEVKFAKRKTAPQQRNKSARKNTIKFCHTILLSSTFPNENTNKEIAPYTLYKTKEPPLISHRKENTLRTYSLERSSEGQITWFTTKCMSLLLSEMCQAWFRALSVKSIQGSPRTARRPKRIAVLYVKFPTPHPLSSRKLENSKIPFSSISPHSHNFSFSPSSLNFWPQFLPPPYSVLPPLYTPSIDMLYFLNRIHITCSFSVF